VEITPWIIKNKQTTVFWEKYNILFLLTNLRNFFKFYEFPDAAADNSGGKQDIILFYYIFTSTIPSLLDTFIECNKK